MARMHELYKYLFYAKASILLRCSIDIQSGINKGRFISQLALQVIIILYK